VVVPRIGIGRAAGTSLLNGAMKHVFDSFANAAFRIDIDQGCAAGQT
jgi:hypothetical protein